jgi:uncharacterized glyoxalase superfamily protein PhnB
MTMAVKPIPDGYHTATPYLFVAGAAKLLDYLAKAFDAKEVQRLRRADGSIMHAEVCIGDSAVMMADPTGPAAEFGPMPCSIYLYVTDCDSVYRRAIEAGGTSLMEPTDMAFSGERYGGVKDPTGNIWWIATHIEDVTPQECARRVEAMMKQ